MKIADAYRYCKYCIFCKENCRKIDINIGVNDTYEVLSSHLGISHLYLYIHDKSKICKDIVEIKICKDTNLTTSSDKNIWKSFHWDNYKETSHFPFTKKPSYADDLFRNQLQDLGIFSKCEKCYSFTTNTNDFNINYCNYLINESGLNRDTFRIADGENNFKIDYYYSSGNLRVAQNGRYIALVNMELMDFSKKEQALKQLKTITNFS